MAFFPEQPTLTIAGVKFFNYLNDPNFIFLGGYSSTGSLDYATYRKPNASSGYQVPGGKTLTIYAISFTSHASNVTIKMGYGDTDVGFASGSAPTTPVYNYGDANGSIILSSNNGTALWRTEYDVVMVVPTGKYVFTQTNNSETNLRVYGYLS